MLKKMLVGLIFISHSCGIYATQKTFERKQDAVLIFRNAPSENFLFWSGAITTVSSVIAAYSLNQNRMNRGTFLVPLFISSYIGIVGSITGCINLHSYAKRNLPILIISKQGIWHEKYGPYNWEHIDLIRAVRNTFNEDIKWIRVETSDAKLYDLDCSNTPVSADRLQLFINEFRPTLNG